MACRFRRIAVKRRADAVKAQRLRRHGFVHGGNIRHQQYRGVARADAHDQRFQGFPTGTLPGRGIKGYDFRRDGHELIHLFHRGGDKHFAFRVIPFDDADDRQRDLLLNGLDIHHAVGTNGSGPALRRRQRHPRHNKRAMQRFILQRLTGDDQFSLQVIQYSFHYDKISSTSFLIMVTCGP